MDEPAAEYDQRYLGGIVCFNRRDFFEAHEVWEDLWQECVGPERRFIQGLIQAAVALYHFGNGNVRGAHKLYHSSRKYMAAYGDVYLGLDNTAFWQAMEHCFRGLLAGPEPDRSAVLDEALIPTIRLDPPPETWPDPAELLPDDETEGPK